MRRFLTRPASNEPLADQVRRFREELEWSSGCQDWQVIQAEQALRIHFVNVLQRTDWHRRPGSSTVVDEHGQTGPLAALEQLRSRIRTRHNSYRTECSYTDGARFLSYVAEQQGAPHPRVESASVRDYLTHVAVRRHVSASTQHQALCAILSCAVRYSG